MPLADRRRHFRFQPTAALGSLGLAGSAGAAQGYSPLRSIKPRSGPPLASEAVGVVPLRVGSGLRSRLGRDEGHRSDFGRDFSGRLTHLRDFFAGRGRDPRSDFTRDFSDLNDRVIGDTARGMVGREALDRGESVPQTGPGILSRSEAIRRGSPSYRAPGTDQGDDAIAQYRNGVGMRWHDRQDRRTDPLSPLRNYPTGGGATPDIPEASRLPQMTPQELAAEMEHRKADMRAGDTLSGQRYAQDDKLPGGGYVNWTPEGRMQVYNPDFAEVNPETGRVEPYPHLGRVLARERLAKKTGLPETMQGEDLGQSLQRLMQAQRERNEVAQAAAEPEQRWQQAARMASAARQSGNPLLMARARSLVETLRRGPADEMGSFNQAQGRLNSQASEPRKRYPTKPDGSPDIDRMTDSQRTRFTEAQKVKGFVADQSYTEFKHHYSRGKTAGERGLRALDYLAKREMSPEDAANYISEAHDSPEESRALLAEYNKTYHVSPWQSKVLEDFGIDDWTISDTRADEFADEFRERALSADNREEMHAVLDEFRTRLRLRRGWIPDPSRARDRRAIEHIRKNDAGRYARIFAYYKVHDSAMEKFFPGFRGRRDDEPSYGISSGP